MAGSSVGAIVFFFFYFNSIGAGCRTGTNKIEAKVLARKSASKASSQLSLIEVSVLETSRLDQRQ